MGRRIWVDIEPREGGVGWSTSQRDADWLESLGWTLELIEIEREPWTTYQEYLQTKWWQGKRKEALIDAGYRCGVCNASGVTLDVHHRTYERLGKERLTDLIVLCRGCHDIFHRNGKLARGKA